jgi:hypothetical protein
MSNINLSPDQHRLIDMYISQYNLVNSQITRLYDMLDDIRYNIQNTIHNNNNRYYRNTSRTTRTPNTFLNRYIDNLINEERQNNFVFYDYNNPINPSLYNNTRQSTNNTRQSTNNTRQSSNNLFRNNHTDVSTFLSNFLNTNVVVRPTNEQINISSRIIRYGDIENPLSESCPISLEHFNNDDMVRQILQCGHVFCQSSFQTWFNSNVRCPVCRYDIRNYRSSQNVNQEDNNPSTNNPSTNNPSTNNTSNNNPSNNNTSTNNTSNNNPSNNNTSTNNPSNNNEENNNSFSNVNIIRNPETNQIDQIAFDITNNLLSNELLNNITSRMFQNILQQNNENDRLIFDPSHNILLYETIISNASTINNRSNGRSNRNNNDSDSENEYLNNIV